MSKKRKLRKKFFRKLQDLMDKHDCSVCSSGHQVRFIFHETDPSQAVTEDVGEHFHYDTVLELKHD